VLKIDTVFDLAKRYIGIHELAGSKDHPLIQWWLSLCGLGIDAADEVPWCSAFVNGMAWELELPRSGSAAARSWLKIGVPVLLADAKIGSDVVVIKRGEGVQPGPEVLNAQGHVGFYAGVRDGNVLMLAGNQGNEVSVAGFPQDRILGIRRLV